MQELLGMLSDLSQVMAQIESYFRHWNIKPQRPGRGMWVIRNIGTFSGGANIDVIIRVIPHMNGTVVVESYTNLLPDPTAPSFSPGTMLALCRDLLEFNGRDDAGDAHFAIKELPLGQRSTPAVTVGIRRPLRGLDPDEFMRCIQHVATLADENDERLAREFNAQKLRLAF